MHQYKILTTGLALAGCFSLALAVCLAGETPPPKAAEPGTLLVVDPAGKEQKIKGWRFTTGTRRLSWLAPAPKPDEKKEDEKKDEGKEEGPRGKRPAGKRAAEPAGPEAVVIRDETKIHFASGVLTFVPIDRLRSVDFDNTNETMTLRVATSAKPEEDATLTGTTAYKGINKLTIEADVDKGEAGVASVTFQGGVPRGMRGVRFPAPKVEAVKEAARPAVVLASDKGIKKAHKVADLMPIYKLPGGEEILAPTLMFKKTLKLSVHNIKSITASDETEELTWQVTTKDGDDSSLTLLKDIPLNGQTGTLQGLVGKVPAGWKYFPLQRIVEVHFDSTDDPREKEPLTPKPKEKPKDKDKDKEKPKDD